LNIYQKLAEVRKSVPFLQKDASGSQYKYNSSSQVIAAVRAKLDEMNLLLITRVVGKRLLSETVEYTEKERPKKTTTYLTELDLEMTWVNCDKPDETIVIPWYAQGVDIAGEKGVGKAMTYGEKTFMLKQFNIPTDQMDVDAHQQRMERTVGKITSNAIAQLKSEWVKAGYKINTLSAQVKKMYECQISDLTEQQVDDLIRRLRDKEGAAS